MSENPVDVLLSVPGASRVALWLWMRDPEFVTADEICEGIHVLSLSRIQQVLRWMYDMELVIRRTRQTSKPGPLPYEYKLALRLFNAIRR